MPLTTRKLQFLQKLMDLYQRTNLPIHYKSLAASLGVSKWTAYDMLKEIEKLGFISRSYETNEKETGRSQVVFVPTAKASELLKPPWDESFDLADWKRTVGSVLSRIGNLQNGGPNEAVREMLAEMPKPNDRIHFCAYMIGLLLIYLKKVGGKTWSLIHHLVHKAPSGETGITMFVGTVLGTAIPTLNDELGDEIAEQVSRFLNSIEALSRKEKEMLSAFLSEAFT